MLRQSVTRVHLFAAVARRCGHQIIQFLVLHQLLELLLGQLDLLVLLLHLLLARQLSIEQEFVDVCKGSLV